MNHKLTVIAHIRAKTGQEARVQEALLGLIELTRAEAGCIDYDLHVSEEDPSNLCFMRIG
jgi:quinol monooxygenase YgiN